MTNIDDTAVDTPVPMNSPRTYVIRMAVFLLIVFLLGVTFLGALTTAFQGNVAINSLILGILVFGVLYAISKVLALSPEVEWVNTFRKGDPGMMVPRKTALLAPMAAMLRDRQGPVTLSAMSTRVILDSMGARLDEDRDNIRYMANLLIFLGIFGTFWGLLQSTGSIQGALDGLSVGASADDAFNDLKEGLKGPLGGMDTAFSSSLFGIAGSLIMGFLGLQVAHAQNRFYKEFEEWLSTITYIASPSLAAGDGAGGGASPEMMAVLDTSMRNVDALRQTIERAEERRANTEQWMVQTTQNIAAMDEVIRAQRELLGGLAAIAKEQAVQSNEHNRQNVELLQSIAASAHHMAGNGGPVPVAQGAASATPMAAPNLGGLEQNIAQLVALTQQSDEKVGKTLASLREIAARLLQHAERGTGDMTVQSLKQLNDTTTQLLAVSQGGGGVVSAKGTAAAPMDPSLLQQLNARLDRLVERADQQREEGVDKASLATLRSLDKTAVKLLQSAESMAQNAGTGAGGEGGAGVGNLQAYLQELVTHARGSQEREILEALRSINTIAHSMRETAEEGRAELLKELRSEMKVLTKTIAALIIESRRDNGSPRTGRD